MSGETHCNESIDPFADKSLLERAAVQSAKWPGLPCYRRLRHQIKTDAASVSCFQRARWRCMGDEHQALAGL